MTPIAPRYGPIPWFGRSWPPPLRGLAGPASPGPGERAGVGKAHDEGRFLLRSAAEVQAAHLFPANVVTEAGPGVALAREPALHAAGRDVKTSRDALELEAEGRRVFIA